jgi:hypothetical protein
VAYLAPLGNVFSTAQTKIKPISTAPDMYQAGGAAMALRPAGTDTGHGFYDILAAMILQLLENCDRHSVLRRYPEIEGAYLPRVSIE